MITIDGQLASLAAKAQLAGTAEAEQKQEEKRSTAGDVLDSVASGFDLVDPAVSGCKAIADAIRPGHVTGGKDLVSGFTTGGGDGIANTFQTVADCAPGAEATVESAGFIADAASVAGDVISGVGDVVGGIVSGIVDGL